MAKYLKIEDNLALVVSEISAVRIDFNSVVFFAGACETYATVDGLDEELKLEIVLDFIDFVIGNQNTSIVSMDEFNEFRENWIEGNNG